MKKLIIVTGASGGIGSELIKLTALEREFQCCAFVRDKRKLCKIVGNDRFQRVLPIVHNFENASDEWKDEVKAAIGSGVQEVALILTACVITPISKVDGLTQDEIKKNIMINVISQVLVVHYVVSCCRIWNIPLKIVQLDSGAAYRPICGWALYCASKSYMSMFLKVLKAEKEAQIALYDPGVVDTDMQRQIRTAAQKNFPDVDQFRKYYMDGKLRSSASVAREIYERYILDWPKENEE